MQELQQLKINTAETASLVVGSKTSKETLCRETQQFVAYYEDIKKKMKVTLFFLVKTHLILILIF